MSVLVDSYSESNYTEGFGIQTAGRVAGQTFQSSAGVLNSVVLYLSKGGSPVGNVYVGLFATSGTFGVDEMPTGAALATSDNIDVSTLGAVSLITFIFTGANKYALVDGVAYAVKLAADFAVNGTDYYSIGIDTSSPSHNGIHFLDTTRFTTRDSIFYVYKDSPPMTITGLQSVTGVSSLIA